MRRTTSDSTDALAGLRKLGGFLSGKVGKTHQRGKEQSKPKWVPSPPHPSETPAPPPHLRLPLPSEGAGKNRPPMWPFTTR